MGAVAAASGTGEPPPILQAVWRCRNWGIPPPDDDYRMVMLMEQVSIAYETVKAWKKPGGKPLSPEQWGVIKHLLKVEAM